MWGRRSRRLPCWSLAGGNRLPHWVALGVMTLIAAALAFVHFREQAPAPDTMRFQIPAPEKANFVLTFPPGVSPDGKRLVFAAAGQQGRTQLWVRSLDALDARPLAGTEGAGPYYFWSPDSRYIAFDQSGKLRKVDASGGPPQTVCDIPGAGRGGAWSAEGVIIFGTAGAGLWRVSEAGGAATQITKVDATRGETYHGHPSFLADGKRFAYLRNSTSPQRFDARRAELAGEAFPVAEGIGSTFQRGFFSASTTGVLAYRAGGGIGGTSQLIWFDRTGKNEGAAGDLGLYSVVSLSPDGKRAAVERTDLSSGGAGNTDVWVNDLVRNTPTRLTFDPNRDGWPVWSPDGSRVAFSSFREGVPNLYRKDSSGQGDQANQDLWVLPLDGPGGPPKMPIPYLKTQFIETEGRFSPDGNFVAYTSSQSGTYEIYVQPFPDPSKGKWQISRGGGAHPRWRRDGKELFYISLVDSNMMAVDISLAPSFKAGVPKTLFQTLILGGGAVVNDTRYDVTADGQKFLINSLAGRENTGAPSVPITVVLNWHAALKK